MSKILPLYVSAGAAIGSHIATIISYIFGIMIWGSLIMTLIFLSILIYDMVYKKE